MAWLEHITLRNGEERHRVCERGPDGRIVKGPLLRKARDADRLAGKTGLDKQREELELVRKDYPLLDFLDEFADRLKGEVTDAYIRRYCFALEHFRRFLAERARGLRKIGQITKPVLLEYRRFRLEEATEPRPTARPASPNPTEELTLREAAEVLGYTKGSTLNLVTEGMLEGRKLFDGKRLPYFVVTRASVDAYMQTPRYQRGRSIAAGHAQRKAEEREATRPKKPPRRLRNRTINIEISMIWTALNKAVEWGLIDENPVVSTKGLRLPESDSREFRALSAEEFDRFRATCPAWLLAPLMAAALLGLRNAEVRYLEWSDLDLGARVIRLRNKLDFQLKSQGHTGVREFKMDLPRSLHDILVDLQRERGFYKDDLVFHNSEGRQFSKDALRRAFANVMKSCGIKDITQVHALRKTFITHMAKRVSNVFLLQEMARHRNIQTTRRYVNVFDEDKKRAMEGFEIGTAPRPPAPSTGDPAAR